MTSAKNTFGAALAAIWIPKKTVMATTGEIYDADGLYFSLSGLMTCKESDFEAVSSILRVLSIDARAEDKISRIKQDLVNPLKAAVQQVHDNNLEDFKQHLAGKEALSIVFFWKKNDGVALSQIGFRTKKRGKDIVLEPRQKDWPEKNTGIHTVAFITAGVNEKTEKAFTSSVTAQQALVYPEDALKKFINLAIAENPDHNKYPVNIMELTPAGARRDTIDAA